MPYLPYSDLNATTNQFPNDGGAGSLANRVIQPVCAALGALGNYVRAATSAAGFPSAVSSFVSGAGVFDRLCQPYTRTDPIPPMPGIGTWGTNCITQGVITYRRASNWGTPSQFWQTFTASWTCTSGRGIPLSGPIWYPKVGLNQGYYEYTFWNSNATAVQTLRLQVSGRDDPPEALQILSFNCTYCPSCNLPNPPIPIPIPPCQSTDTVPPEPPQITVNIDFPRGWGLPPLTVPVIFSPIIVSPGAVSVQPTLTLAPRIDINPDFAFAPTIEFNLGGISIGGGGHPVPEGDMDEVCGCDCPELPPIEEVDYPRIQRIVSAVASTFRELPGSPATFTPGAWVEGTFIEVAIAPGGRYIRYEFNLDEYTGGATFGQGDVPDIVYPGWLTFGIDETAAKGSERLFLNYQNGFIPIPPWSRVCYIHTQSGATVRARVESLEPLPIVE